MAKPRVFISSTYYDLKHIRNDLEKFIRELGYEAVKNEGGDIPYGKKKTLEDYCYREINNVDILINIIGGRYGSASKEEPYSISQKELKVAHELNKQIYIFVQQSVLVEYKTYLKNEANENFMPEYVDNIQIYKFLKEVYNYPTNNTVVGFSKVSDITVSVKYNPHSLQPKSMR